MKLEAWRDRTCGWLRCVLASLAGLAAGCGSGTAGLLSGSDDDGGDPAPTLAACSVLSPKVSPAHIELTAAGKAGSALVVELLYALPGEDLRPMTQLSGPGAAGNRVTLPASQTGTATQVEWDFPAELGDARFQPAVRLVARPPGGSIPTTGDLTLGIGNDVPVVEEVLVPVLESSGNVAIDLRVSDSSSDVVTLRAEWRRADAPLDPWLPATAAGLFPQGIETRPAAQGGAELTFFWDTGVDLGEMEHDVLVRFTPDDRTLDPSGNPVGIGQPREGAPLRVDNNEEPIATLDSGPLIVNPDERRCIPVPFRVFDEESDPVQVFFQWRRTDETFADLPIGRGELEALQGDARLRREHHLCTPYPRYAQGRVEPLDATRVRLPELALGESWITATGLEGRALELLRPSQNPAPLAPGWSANPLAFPVAALPVADGLTAIVVDAPGSAGRVREIELATGRVVREIALLASGRPTAAAFEGGERAVLVAGDLGGMWVLVRVDVTSGGRVEELYASSAADEPGPVRGIASLGPKTALLTAGRSLYQLDLAEAGAARLHALRDDLATPWGVAADPRLPNRVYVAEQSADRILVLELDTRQGVPVVVQTAPLALQGPQALALERGGARLLVLGQDPSGLRLFGMDFGNADAGSLFALSAPFAGQVSGLSAGPDGLRLLALSEANDLAGGGGVEQRRTIQSGTHPAHDPATRAVNVSSAFEPAPRTGQPWRIAAHGVLSSRPEGVSSTFPWDASADVPAGGEVLLRAIPLDVEVGVLAEGVTPKPIRAALRVEPLVTHVPIESSFPYGGLLTSADLNRDGLLDLAWTHQGFDTVNVLYQSAPGRFDGPPLVLMSGSIDSPLSVTAADLDVDGNMDLVSANSDSGNLAVFFQHASGGFDPPILLGSLPDLRGASTVVAADLDGDGDLDLASSNIYGVCLTVFFQTAPRTFAPPLLIDPTPDVETAVDLVSADLDGDGDLDLACANEVPNNVMVFFQTSPGRFDDPPTVLLTKSAFPAVNIFSLSLSAADLDVDGDLDLAAGISGSHDVFWQDTPGHFAEPPTVLPLAGTTPQSLIAADLDGNGALDLIFERGVYFQSRAGVFDEVPIANLIDPSTFDYPTCVTVADLDGDGDLDFAGGVNDRLEILFQDSAGRFATEPTELATGASIPRTPLGADLDDDGDLDLAMAGIVSERNGVVVFRQDSPGRFDDVPETLGAPWANAAAACVAADLDGDGDLDLASANPYDDDTSPFGDDLNVFFQSQPGVFDGPPLSLQPSPGRDGPIALVAADLDRDGDLDLASANRDANSLAIFFQTAPGTFDEPPLLLDGYAPRTLRDPLSLAAGDLDGDGAVDLVTANGVSDNLTILFQTEPGRFDRIRALEATPSSTDWPVSVIAVDVDGDGDLDLAAALRNVDQLGIFYQTSPGVFASPAQVLELGPASRPLLISSGDLDRDGDLELVSANFDRSVTAFFQTAPGRFDDSPLVLEGSTVSYPPEGLAIVDLDADGDVEIVCVFRNRVRVFWGGR